MRFCARAGCSNEIPSHFRADAVWCSATCKREAQRARTGEPGSREFWTGLGRHRRRSRGAGVLAAILVALLALAGCGGHNHQSATGSKHPAGWGITPKGVALPAPTFTLAPTATMYDSIVLSTVPGHPFAAAGYTSGYWPTYEPMRRAWPTAHVVSIAINASHHANCLDVEPGDAVPSQAGSWARADIAAGFRTPCLYSDLAEMPAVRASLAQAGLARSRYLLWLAWYTGRPGLVSGYDAVQYTDSCLGRNLDCSTVSLAFLTVAQPPYVAPKPPPPLPVCFHKREAVSTCAAVKVKVASFERAEASSQRAWTARGCVGIRQRRNWFFQHIKRPPKSKRAYRTAAYQASVRAFQRQACPVFGGWQGTAGRIGYFAGRIRTLEAAN